MSMLSKKPLKNKEKAGYMEGVFYFEGELLYQYMQLAHTARNLNARGNGGGMAG